MTFPEATFPVIGAPLGTEIGTGLVGGPGFTSGLAECLNPGSEELFPPQACNDSEMQLISAGHTNTFTLLDGESFTAQQ
jgi:hypothetical protein